MSGPSTVSSSSENSYGPEIQHLYNTIETYTEEELHSKGIAAIWCEVQEIADSCSIFIADFSKGESLLMKKQISALTVNQDYRSEIDAALLHTITAKKVEAVKSSIFERFNNFTKGLEKESASDGVENLSYKLEPVRGASGEEEIFRLVGWLQWKGQNYSIHFDDPIDCKDEKSQETLQRAIKRAEAWSSDISHDNIESKLKEQADGVKITLEKPKREPRRMPRREQRRTESPSIDFSMPLSELIPMMRQDLQDLMIEKIFKTKMEKFTSLMKIEKFTPDPIFRKKF